MIRSERPAVSTHQNSVIIDCHCTLEKRWPDRSLGHPRLRSRFPSRMKGGHHTHVLFPAFHTDYLLAERPRAIVAESERFSGFAFISPGARPRSWPHGTRAVEEHGFVESSSSTRRAYYARNLLSRAKLIGLPVLIRCHGANIRVRALATEYPDVSSSFRTWAALRMIGGATGVH